MHTHCIQEGVGLLPLSLDPWPLLGCVAMPADIVCSGDSIPVTKTTVFCFPSTVTKTITYKALRWQWKNVGWN